MNGTDLKMEKDSQIEHPDISQITDDLYISSLPKYEHADHILSLGIRLIISMPLYRPPSVYRRSPFDFIHCPSLDTPLTPIPLFILRRGVTAALPVIGEGDSVLVHCKSGVHRSVAMACCILIAGGYSAENAMRLVKEKRDKADPYISYIRKRIEKFESNWRNDHV
jgi:protein tyrosine phosphatase (PTP) superfamily phosphohydrolase (DUF442 family)